MGRSWIHVEAACAPEFADELGGRIAGEFGIGIELASPGVGFYLDDGDLPARWEERLQKTLDEVREAFGLAAAFPYTRTVVAEEDWARQWKSHFKPLRVGRRFVVCPTWEEFEPGPGDLVIRIDPGMAFGTGHHETTRLCLEWLDDCGGEEGDAGPRSLLDVGTGSGILAVGAVLLGCRPVVGVDVDPEALEVAAENVEVNGMENAIRLRECSAADIVERFDLVVANIQAYPLMDMAGALSARVARGGAAALCGILVEQKEVVRAAYEAQGLIFRRARIDGEWCLLEFGMGEGASRPCMS